MQVRKFQANSIPEATKMVKKSLGANALILSTRRIEDNSDGGGKKAFEIWAVPNEMYNDQNVERNESQLESLDGLKTDLLRIQDLLYLMSENNDVVERLVSNTDALDLYKRLTSTGISQHYINRFLKTGGAFDKNTKTEGRTLRRLVLSDIINSISVTDPFRNINKNQVVAAFVGPTGVGKTTTIAKLAADIKLKKKKNVGLITIDNYRIGAMEQLRSYATILGVPCFPAFNNKDLRLALRRLREKDVVMIDTAGQSQYDTARMFELEGIIGKEKSISCHLLLSTSIREKEMESVANNFGRLNVESFIFTKTDEAKNRGIIINQLIKSKIPASFVTTGQRVPEDIVKATKTGILSLMFQ